MRILVFLDTPRQLSYVTSVEAATATVPGSKVLVGGPGVTDSYFGLAGGAADIGEEIEHSVGFAAKIRLALTRWRTRWRNLCGWIWKKTQRVCRASKVVLRSLLMRWRMLWNDLFIWKLTRSAGRALKFILRPLLRYWRTLGLNSYIWKLTGPVWRTLKFIRKPFPPRLPVRSVSRFLRHGWHTIRKLPPLLRRLVMFCLQMIVAMVVLVAVTLNAGGIMRQVVQRQLYIREAAGLIRRARPDVLVLMEDNVEGLTGVVTFAARRAGVPVVVLPDYIPNPIEPATYYWDSKPHQVRTLLDWLVTAAFPKWKYRHNGRRMLRMPSVTITAYHILRCDPPAPWILNSGYAAAIALDSMAMHARYRTLGFRSEKLRVIGTAQDDKLHERFVHRESLRKALLDDRGLPNDRPIVLCAFPPDQYTTADTSSFEYSSYEALVDAWFTTLAASADRANVIVRPHPRTRPGELEKRCPQGVSIVWTPTEDLIPMCDLYVASVSTTIRWALGLGLPVLNYDCYRYAYGDFTTAKGVLECSDRATFATNLQSLVADPSQLAASSWSDRQSWGQVDGNYAGRLQDLLQRVSGAGFKAQSTHMTPLPGTTLIRTALARARSSR